MGHTDYYDDTGAIQNMVSQGMETTQTDYIILSNLVPCTKYTITITGWNTVTTITSKPQNLQTLANGNYHQLHAAFSYDNLVCSCHSGGASSNSICCYSDEVRWSFSCCDHY